MTFPPGELEALEDKIAGRAPAPTAPSTADADLSGATLPPLPDGSSGSSRSGRSRLLKEHACTVSYPDGQGGVCRYERRGPAAHLFEFSYFTYTEYNHGDGDDSGKGESSNSNHSSHSRFLSRQWLLRPLGNTPADIDQAACELAPVAFAEAVERERREYFGRASPSPTRSRKQPDRFQMSAARAKEIGGHYALCLPVGSWLIPLSEPFAKIEEANTAWRKEEDKRLVVGCVNRLDRCWERPRLNPLYQEYPHMRPSEPTPL
jgi:hypothetical protein